MIQIDETGLPLYALYNNWQISRDVWIAGRYFSSLVAPAADYLTGTLNQRTGLPAPSYDLWEERRGVHTYSACTVYAGLKGASHLARVMGADLEEERWLKAALRVKSAIPDLLYDHSLGHFKRSLTDSTLDSSAFAVWYFGVLPPDDEMVVNTTREIENQLKRPSGGFARYKNDSYQGYMNSWIICTLWLAQWHIATGNLSRAMDLIRWCAEHAHPAGLMPEQVGEDGSPGSVLPLMWSHCAFVLAVLEYLEAIESRALDHQKLLESPEC
jgi:GH15 family glucan-1,4-alpha-glucosidase